MPKNKTWELSIKHEGARNKEASCVLDQGDIGTIAEWLHEQGGCVLAENLEELFSKTGAMPKREFNVYPTIRVEATNDDEAREIGDRLMRLMEKDKEVRAADVEDVDEA